MDELSAIIIKLQGDGDYNGVVKLLKQMGDVDNQLKTDLEKLNNAGIPVDIYFDQGVEVLGLLGNDNIKLILNYNSINYFCTFLKC